MFVWRAFDAQAYPADLRRVAVLKQRLRHEHDSHKKPRLQMLHLLATRQAPHHQDVARLLGVHRFDLDGSVDRQKRPDSLVRTHRYAQERSDMSAIGGLEQESVRV